MSLSAGLDSAQRWVQPLQHRLSLRTAQGHGLPSEYHDRYVPTLPAASACLTFAKYATLPTLPPEQPSSYSSSSSPRACGLDSCGQAAARLVENIRHTWRAALVLPGLW
uniref:Uncharacterized protein n=1 Tax=Knipowitschia caucasica TaxID=637954 RepID=A0AAV2KZ50_KNICA